MTSYAKPLLRLLDALERLPGIGPRSAERIAFHLLRLPKEEARQLAQAVVDVKEQLRFCEVCFNLSEATRCAICEDPTRDASLLCLVEEPKDVLSIEKTGTFRGLYHVLLGAIAPLDGIGPELLKIDELLARLADGAVQEIVIATDADKDGETTAAYLSKLLRGRDRAGTLLAGEEVPRAAKPAADRLKITRLASGIPVGSHLEYADSETLSRALEGRRELL